jgi:hypothetical protein
MVQPGFQARRSGPASACVAQLGRAGPPAARAPVRACAASRRPADSSSCEPRSARRESSPARRARPGASGVRPASEAAVLRSRPAVAVARRAGSRAGPRSTATPADDQRPCGIRRSPARRARTGGHGLDDARLQHDPHLGNRDQAARGNSALAIGVPSLRAQAVAQVVVPGSRPHELEVVAEIAAVGPDARDAQHQRRRLGVLGRLRARCPESTTFLQRAGIPTLGLGGGRFGGENSLRARSGSPQARSDADVDEQQATHRRLIVPPCPPSRGAEELPQRVRERLAGPDAQMVDAARLSAARGRRIDPALAAVGHELAPRLGLAGAEEARPAADLPAGSSSCSTTQSCCCPALEGPDASGSCRSDSTTNSVRSRRLGSSSRAVRGRASCARRSGRCAGAAATASRARSTGSGWTRSARSPTPITPTGLTRSRHASARPPAM